MNNFIDYKSFVEKLCVMSNNYYLYNEEYIKNKYNIETYDKFRRFFKKNHNDKLIFNSQKSENFFIKVMNLDPDYMLKKYGNTQSEILINFFIQRNNCIFNDCEEISETLTKKVHINDCKCKIKVKSVVNLSINALIFILIENDHHKKNNIENVNNTIVQNKSNVNIIAKLYNTDANKKIIESIKKIENIKKKMGIVKNDVNYILTDTKPNVENNVFDINKNIFIENTCMNDLLDNAFNTKKINEQLISESINLDEKQEENNNFKINSVFEKNDKEQIKNNNLSEEYDRLNNLKKYAEDNKTTFNVNDLEESSASTSSNEKSDNSSDIHIDNKNNDNNDNRFGNIIVAKNKVKIEKTQLDDLKNSSDILISYNEYNNNNNIKNNFISVNNILNSNSKKENTDEIDSDNENETESDDNSETDNVNESDDTESNKKYEKQKEIVHNAKKEVIEILNYLDDNFNYITSDDFMIDKDKKMQICTFMVEIKYKIFGMFRQLEKEKNIIQQYKSRIANNYEKIYNYVVKSNKIGSTGEMVEFKNKKELIQYIIKDIIEL